MNYKYILFDLDGTLTDPKVGITKSVQHALGKYGIHIEDLDELVPFIGPPLAQSFMERLKINESEAKRAVEYYREYFKDKGTFENVIYPGIPDLLQLLVSQGRSLMVATSKPTVFAEKILDYFEIHGYFDYVAGSKLDGTRSDKTEIIQHLFDEVKMDRETTVMIGDRKHDIIGAHNCKIDSIAVRYGYGSEDELRASQPTHIVHSSHELQAILI